MPRKKGDKRRKLTEHGEDVWAAEKLLRKRVVRQQVQYLVRWRGYTDSDNTWEPAENILDSRLIKDFEVNQVKSKAESLKTIRSKQKEDKTKQTKEQSESQNESEIEKSKEQKSEEQGSTSAMQDDLQIENVKEDRFEDENRIEQERIEQERIEQERVEQKRIEQERVEQKRIEQERIEQQNDHEEANPKDDHQVSNQIVEQVENRLDEVNYADEQNDEKIEQQMDEPINLYGQKITTHLLIPVSELEKLKSSKLTRQPCSSTAKSSLLIQQPQLSPSINHQRPNNQTSLLKQTSLVSPVQRVQTVPRPNQAIQLQSQSPKQNQRTFLINQSAPSPKQLNQIKSNLVDELNSSNLNSSLDHNLSINVMNLTSALSNDHLMNSSPCNRDHQTSSPSNHFNNFKNQIVNPNIKLNSSSPFYRNQITHNLVNIVNPTINLSPTNQATPFNQSNLIQTVPSISSLLNGSSAKHHQIQTPANSDHQASFQETSNAILCSKRTAQRIELPHIFWRNNNLLNQIVITDVVSDDNVGVTIRECKTSQHFFTKGTKKLKKLKQKANLKSRS